MPGPLRWWRREVIMYFSYTLRKPDLMLCTWAMIMPLLLLYLVTKYCAVLYPKNRLVAYYVGVSLIHTTVICTYNLPMMLL
jgi:hypothetical protein